jgi:hypothetical protein
MPPYSRVPMLCSCSSLTIVKRSFSRRRPLGEIVNQRMSCPSRPEPGLACANHHLPPAAAPAGIRRLRLAFGVYPDDVGSLHETAAAGPAASMPRIAS